MSQYKPGPVRVELVTTLPPHPPKKNEILVAFLIKVSV
jgi:hypothetical protein